VARPEHRCAESRRATLWDRRPTVPEATLERCLRADVRISGFLVATRRTDPTPCRLALSERSGDPCPDDRRGNRTLERTVEPLCLDNGRP
jgi:hypothetical protein